MINSRRAGEAVHGVLQTGASAQVDVMAALAWRDCMVSDYSDTGAAQWLADRDVALLRARRDTRSAKLRSAINTQTGCTRRAGGERRV
jgi:hypothetical protein